MKHFRTIAFISIPLTGITEFCQVYIFSDWEYLKYLVVAVVLDTLLGIYKNWIIKNVNSKAYGDVIKKLILYSSAIILSNVVSEFTIKGEEITTFNWFANFLLIFLIVREAISIVENIEAIMPGFFPKWVVTRLKDFDSNTGEKLLKNK